MLIALCLLRRVRCLINFLKAAIFRRAGQLRLRLKWIVKSLGALQNEVLKLVFRSIIPLNLVVLSISIQGSQLNTLNGSLWLLLALLRLNMLGGLTVTFRQCGIGVFEVRLAF